MGHPVLNEIKKYSGYILGVVVLILAVMSAGINESGQRTYIQLPWGTTYTKFAPGPYLNLMGPTWKYSDVLTNDFSSMGELQDDGTVKGRTCIPVRYQDGGTGHVCGTARLTLPNDPDAMEKVHKEFRSEQGIRNKIFSPTLKESMQLTAGLMTSEDGYAVRRGDFASWAEDQFVNGVYRTTLTQIEVQVEPATLDDAGKVVKAAVMRKKDIPIIATDEGTGMPIHQTPDIAKYQFNVSGFAINDWVFESKTLEQIDTKREAEMAIITSKAKAEQAKQEEQQKVAEGKKAVAERKYEKEVEKVASVVDAKRLAEVAVIDAERQVAVNQQNVLAQKEDVLAATEEAKAIKLRADAKAYQKREILAADNALAQRIDAYIQVNRNYAEHFGKQKWVPELVMSGSGEGAEGGNSAAAMIDLLSVKTAKDLSLDMNLDGIAGK